MEFVNKCKKVWRRHKRLHPENSASYGKLSNKQQKKPHGTLSVYVGPERQRFVINIQILNHPLFKTLLDDAEREYGYTNHGPLCLPCHVDFFCQALAQIQTNPSLRCTYINNHSPSSLFRAHYHLLV